MHPTNVVVWRERYLDILTTPDGSYHYWSLPKLAKDFNFILNEQPFVVRIFIENLMRHYGGNGVAKDNQTSDCIKALTAFDRSINVEFPFHPRRILMQDYTGVPAIVDIAAMRDAVSKMGGNESKVNPLCPVDLVIDHSVTAEQAGCTGALEHNRQQEMERNQERYQFLKWAEQSFENFRVVPPGRGICHQINLEYFAQVISCEDCELFPDTVIGTDSHTTMINGLGVLGWGVGGIEAEAVMLGQPLTLNLPQVVGVKLEGKLSAGTTATDLVLSITEILRRHGVVRKYVEFYGPGVLLLSVADRATVANMAPEYGATCALFPIDSKVIEYLRLTNRPASLITQVKTYASVQSLYYTNEDADPVYQENIVIDVSETVTSLAGPKRPQDRLALSEIKNKTLEELLIAGYLIPEVTRLMQRKPDLKHKKLNNGDLVIAAITSCTNTSNPHVMLLAGLLAKAAVERGLSVNPNVKTSLAPGSQVVARYLDNTGLQAYLDLLGFNRIGFGCTTCIGNSGPLNGELEAEIESQQLKVSAVLSGNRNFEGRIHPSVQLNWLMSPPLVIAFALAGHTRINLTEEPLGIDKEGHNVFLSELWPSEEIVAEMSEHVTQELFEEAYKGLLEGDDNWKNLDVKKSVCYPWMKGSTYIRPSPFLSKAYTPESIKSARILAILGDSVTTDHISPAGNIGENSPAGKYLRANNVEPRYFNSYGARRGNHEVMVRGTFANAHLKNSMVYPDQGGLTRYFSIHSNSTANVPIYDASQKYIKENTPLVVFAGKEYCTGSSRDWAAKGCLLLNIKAVIAESFERIHRSNLTMMGILPLQLIENVTVNELQLKGDEIVHIDWGSCLSPGQALKLIIQGRTNEKKILSVIARIDNERELNYFLAGGVLNYVTAQYVGSGCD
tara:strand:- start:13199 stop:15901 length:2703 start_codon:yes stop_codon:yes gene_type:complete